MGKVSSQKNVIAVFQLLDDRTYNCKGKMQKTRKEVANGIIRMKGGRT